MKLNMLLLAGVVFFGATSAEAQSKPAYTYVGSWDVSSGPYWGDQPLSYTGQQAAALLFGGAASDYVISSVGANPLTIDDSAWYGVLGSLGPNNGAFLFSQDYVSPTSTQATGYYFSGNYDYTFDGTDAASSYVGDNVRSGVTNYAFRVQAVSGGAGAVPEPATWAMMMVGFGMIGFGLRRRSKVTTKVSFA